MAATNADMLRSLIAQDAAVARVGYRLAVASRELCPRAAPLSGLLVHSPVQYAPEYRTGLAEVTGLADGYGIAAVAAGSPAEAAGLRAGDQLTELAGQSLIIPESGKADYNHVSALNARIDSAMASGSLQLTVTQAGGVPKTLHFRPETGCAVQFQVSGGKGWDASTDGKVITLQSGMVAGTTSDAELAVAVAHELAHVIYRDPQRAGPKPAGGREARADVVGQYLMARAGFDPAAAATFWDRYGDKHPLDFMGTTGGHASPKGRAKLARETAADIAWRQASGLELWPDQYPRPER